MEILYRSPPRWRLSGLCGLLLLSFPGGCSSGDGAPPPDPAAEAGAAASASSTEACWDEEFTFETCCRTASRESGAFVGAPGNAACWGEGFTFHTCCRPERAARLQRGLGMIREGRFREASHLLFELWVAYSSKDGDSLDGDIFHGFEKAAVEFKRALTAMPDSLTHFEVLFNGLGIDCEPPDGPSAPHQDFIRCCMDEREKKTERACFQVYDMMMMALGRTRTDLESYYNDFSEQWAYRHFTPSIFLTSDVPEGEADAALARAQALDGAVAKALIGGGEPPLGIVWAEHVPSFRSVKFQFNTNFLTLAFHHIRRDPRSLAGSRMRPLHVIEVGGGYGNVARLLGLARAGLAKLEPPVRLAGYTCFDLRSVSDLQHWYLAKTLGDRIRLRDWKGPEDELWGRLSDGSAVPTWPDLEEGRENSGAAASEPMPVDLVESTLRDVFVHLYGQGTSSKRGALEPIRLVMAVNSWHEMPMNEFLWYYNEFMTGPTSRILADWVLYVSNVKWRANDVKENLMLNSRSQHKFEIVYDHCSVNCVRLLKRTASS